MKLVLAFIVLLAPLATSASHEMGTFPSALTYKGKPIDALCVTERTHPKATVDLNHCGVTRESAETIVGENEKLVAEGYVGHDFNIKINKEITMRGYAYYKIFGMQGSAVIIQTIYHGGGSGEVSSLSLVQRDGHHITVTALNVGDRCNHGIIDVNRVQSAKGDYLRYRLKLTSYDFLTLAHQNPHHLKAFTDLADCAVCCKATAVYQRTIGADFLNEKLRYVDLAAFPQEEIASTEPQSYQVCFDRLLQTYIKNTQSKLNFKQLVGFMKKFNTSCAQHLVPYRK